MERKIKHIFRKMNIYECKEKKKKQLFFLQYFVLRTNMSNEIKTNRFFCRKLNSFVLFVCVCVSRIFISFFNFSLFIVLHIRAHRGDLQTKQKKKPLFIYQIDYQPEKFANKSTENGHFI